MAKFSLKFDTDNAAFGEEGEWEVARILENTAMLVQNGFRSGFATDSNGNNVGTWSLTLPEAEDENDD